MAFKIVAAFACLFAFTNAGFHFGHHDDGQWHGEGLLESQDHDAHHDAHGAIAHEAHDDDGQWHGEGLAESQDHEGHDDGHGIAHHAVPHLVAYPHPVPLPIPHPVPVPVPVAHHVPVAVAHHVPVPVHHPVHVPVVHVAHHDHHGFAASVAGPSGHVHTHF